MVVQVTVLFTDLVDFTLLSSQLPTARIVQLLHELFTSYDGLCEKHNVFKVDTIGKHDPKYSYRNRQSCLQATRNYPAPASVCRQREMTALFACLFQVMPTWWWQAMMVPQAMPAA